MSRYIRNLRYRCVECGSSCIYINQGHRTDCKRDRAFAASNPSVPKIRCNECRNRSDYVMDLKIQQEINARVSNIDASSKV